MHRRLSLPALVLSLVAAPLVFMTAAPAGAAEEPASEVATEAAACSTAPTGGTVTRSFWMSGQGFRSYNLRVPAGLSGVTPLLVDLHGLGSNAFFQETTTGWSAQADARKFIVAYPAGSAWGQAWDVNQGSADVAFIKEMVARIKATYCVDGSRVFAEGGSLGGMMTQRVLCDAEDVFASGVSTISAGYDYFGGTCGLSRKVAVGIINVEGDPLFPTAVGKATRDKWLALDNCSGDPVADPNPYGANGEVHSCADGTHVLFRTYAGSQHAYPTGAALSDFHDTAWEFLMAHPKP